MIKKLILIFIALIIGLGIAFGLESFFREQIQRIFKWATSDHIIFTGKNFYIFDGYFYYLSFMVSFLIFGVFNYSQQTKKLIVNGILGILIFIISVITISSIDAKLKILECTACENGIRKIHWNDINYGLILGTSIILSILPTLLTITKNKKPAHNNV